MIREYSFGLGVVPEQSRTGQLVVMTYIQPGPYF